MTVISVALAGNPNAGKTTIFNAVTGARQHVGNYPGITVEKKEGIARRGSNEFHITDLPGTYSLTAYSPEELVARNYILDERPQVVIDVLNAGALERNLYLAVQFMEMGMPFLIVLNMMDEAERQGLKIDLARLSELLGVPVVAAVGRAGKGMDEMLGAAAKLAQETDPDVWHPLDISYGPDLDPVIDEMARKIEQAGFMTERYPARWLAIKYLEDDEEVRMAGREWAKNPPQATSGEAKAMPRVLEELAAKAAEHCNTTLQTDPEAIIADYRYGFITSIMKQGVMTREGRAERMAFSDRMDRVLTQRFLGPVIMLLVLLAVYKLTFDVGEIPMGWLEMFFGWLGETASVLIPEGLVQSLVVSGIIDGVGGVLGFVPLIAVIFLCIAFLEDSGYMARVAYMMDRVFRVFGLHGSSVMPFIISGGIGGGCAVPGVMATRTLRSEREKIATLLTLPMMTCGAKLPVFILLVGIFFPNQGAQALFLITLASWAIALLSARIIRSTVVPGPSTPFVMELPPYRLPTLRGVLIHTWERTWQYIKKAGTVILGISILIWALMTFPQLPAEQVTGFEAERAQAASTIQDEEARAGALEAIDMREGEEALKYSVAGRLGTFFEPVSRLAGFEWRTNIALIGGFAAKEVIVTTLGTAYSLGEVEPPEEEDGSSALAQQIKADPGFSQATGVALIFFVLIYAPCFVTVVTMAREAGWKWASFSVVFSTGLAFVLAVAAYQITRLVS